MHRLACNEFLCSLNLLLIISMSSLLVECFGDSLAPKRSSQFGAHRSRRYERGNNISPHSKRFIAIDIRDKIIELQCLAKCEEALINQANNYNDGSTDHFTKMFINCHETCRLDAKRSPRPGFCPEFQNETIEELSCMDNCSYDYDCPEVQKCCASTCGPICLQGLGVREDTLLPEIPKILKHKLPLGHKVEITIASATNQTCYYHVEARSHFGLLYSPRKLGAWHWQPVEKIAEFLDTRTKRTDVAFNAKPGRWYQVRVAAINAYGFRGYSDPLAFTLQRRVKPPKQPVDLKVDSTQIEDDFFNVKIVWCPSKSNLPVEKYRVIWSLYVKFGGDSMISNESDVKDAHQFVINKLLPDSSYYIQVQALSIIGRRRLKSQKIALFFNTTSISKARKNVQPYEPLKCSKHHHDFQESSRKHEFSSGHAKAQQLSAPTETSTAAERAAPIITQNQHDVRFRMNRKLGMIVQISGFHPRKERVYELCPKEVNCEQREYSAIRAKKNSLEFSKLKYNTTYVLKAFHTDVEENFDENRLFTFTTPKCENFKKRFPKMQIQC